jgi:hypothetical protein
MGGVCNVWMHVCVCACLYGFCIVWTSVSLYVWVLWCVDECEFVCVGFVMCGRVYVCV